MKAIRRPSDLNLQFICTFYYDFVIFADTMSSCVVRTTNVSLCQHALECDVCRQRTTFFCVESDGYTFLVLVQGRKFQGTTVPGSESSRERKFHVTFAPGSESSRERKFQGTKVPGSESTRERKFHLWYFRSWERKYVGTKVPVTVRITVQNCIPFSDCWRRSKGHDVTDPMLK